MSRYGSADTRYVDAMGVKLANVFHGLYTECILLHQYWNEYVVLYGTKPERFELMNDAAGRFFKHHQDLAWQGTLLLLCRITDKSNMRGREDLSLHRLLPLAEPTIKAEVDLLLREVIKSTEFARDWRNRYLAHNDLDLALGDSPTKLRPASRKSVKDALASIVAVLALFESHYLEQQTAYDLISSPGGAESLLHTIRDGLEAQKQRHGRFRTGNLLPEDVLQEPEV